jgi:hypothetical protein
MLTCALCVVVSGSGVQTFAADAILESLYESDRRRHGVDINLNIHNIIIINIESVHIRLMVHIVCQTCDWWVWWRDIRIAIFVCEFLHTTNITYKCNEIEHTVRRVSLLVDVLISNESRVASSSMSVVVVWVVCIVSLVLACKAMETMLIHNNNNVSPAPTANRVFVVTLLLFVVVVYVQVNTWNIIVGATVVGI